MDKKTTETTDYTRYTMIGHFYNFDDFEEFKSDMEKLATQKNNVVIDISRITFLNSRGLGVFVSAARLFLEKELKCLLYCPREEILNTIKVAGIDLVVKVVDNEEAITRFFKS